jgi:hypothetical protein
VRRPLGADFVEKVGVAWGAANWAMAPAGLRGVVNDALAIHLAMSPSLAPSSPDGASAFALRQARQATSSGMMRHQPRRRCTGRHRGERCPGYYRAQVVPVLPGQHSQAMTGRQIGSWIDHHGTAVRRSRRRGCAPLTRASRCLYLQNIEIIGVPTGRRTQDQLSRRIFLFLIQRCVHAAGPSSAAKLARMPIANRLYHPATRRTGDPTRSWRRRISAL